MRFDEIELESVPLGIEEEAPMVIPAGSTGAARRDKRLLALLTDLSLFAALVLVLSPLLPEPPTWPFLPALSTSASS